MPGVVIAIAEEDDEVERRRAACSTCRTSSGLAGPSLSSQRELVGNRVRLVEDLRRERRPKSCGLRSCATGKRRTVTPFTCSTPAGSSFFQVT